MKDTQNIADILVDPTGEKESRDHWQTTAHSLLSGAILHVLYAEQDKTLAGVASFLSDPGRTQSETLDRMLKTPHLGQSPHPAVAQAAREMLNKSENELSGVFSTAMACLGLYRDPVIAENTSSSDFRIADLMNADRPVSLYLVVPPSDLARTRPIIRLILNQIGRRLTESMHFGTKTAYRHRLLLLLDEFPSLGRLDFFESSLAFIAGYGLKAFLIAQSLNQLEKAYGPHNSILDNCHVRLTYAANDDRTARRISNLLGQATEKKLQKSFSGSGFFLTNRTESEQEYARALLTPAEVNQLPQDDAILLVGGVLPYRAKKVRYFLDPRFQGREGMPTPDLPAEQRRELFGPVPNDWKTTPASPRGKAAPKASDASAPRPAQSRRGEASQAEQLPARTARSGALRHRRKETPGSRPNSSKTLGAASSKCPKRARRPLRRRAGLTHPRPIPIRTTPRACPYDASPPALSGPALSRSGATRSAHPLLRRDRRDGDGCGRGSPSAASRQNRRHDAPSSAA